MDDDREDDKVVWINTTNNVADATVRLTKSDGGCRSQVEKH